MDFSEHSINIQYKYNISVKNYNSQQGPSKYA